MFAIDSANAAFYRAMDVLEDKVFLVPYTIDNVHFQTTSQLTDAEQAE